MFISIGLSFPVRLSTARHFSIHRAVEILEENPFLPNRAGKSGIRSQQELLQRASTNNICPTEGLQNAGKPELMNSGSKKDAESKLAANQHETGRMNSVLTFYLKVE